MGDELKVTVVATGLGDPVKPGVMVNNSVAGSPVAGSPVAGNPMSTEPVAVQQAQADARSEEVRQSEVRADGRPEYGHDLDRPTIFRQRDAVVSQQSNLALDQESDDMEWIDIPAFLRRQAD